MDPLIPAMVMGFAVMKRESDRAHIINEHRAVGVHPDLLKLLDDWKRYGSFDVQIAPDGGLRTDEAKQLAYFKAGNSKAKTLKETPHGRGAAIDVWPMTFNPTLPRSLQSTAERQFQEFAEFAEARGFETGYSWGWDAPHIEIKFWWEKLPFPVPKEGWK